MKPTIPVYKDYHFYDDDLIISVRMRAQLFIHAPDRAIPFIITQSPNMQTIGLCSLSSSLIERVILFDDCEGI